MVPINFSPLGILEMPLSFGKIFAFLGETLINFDVLLEVSCHSQLIPARILLKTCFHRTSSFLFKTAFVALIFFVHPQELFTFDPLVPLFNFGKILLIQVFTFILFRSKLLSIVHVRLPACEVLLSSSMGKLKIFTGGKAV